MRVERVSGAASGAVMKVRVAAVVLLGSVVLGACADGNDDAEASGFEPVAVGASGFREAAPQPNAAGQLSVSKAADGATFFARVEEPGETPFAEGDRAAFRLAGVTALDEEAGDCLARPSTTHLNGMLRGGMGGENGVRFVVADGVDVDALDEGEPIPVHVWSRRVWVNGEVLARGYGELAEDAGEHEEGRWNPSLCGDGGAAADEEG
jgi:hypothetical protein